MDFVSKGFQAITLHERDYILYPIRNMKEGARVFLLIYTAL